MVNFTGSFVQYTMEANTASTSAVSTYDRVFIETTVNNKINYINVADRPVIGQVFPR